MQAGRPHHNKTTALEQFRRFPLASGAVRRYLPRTLTDRFAPLRTHGGVAMRRKLVLGVGLAALVGSSAVGQNPGGTYPPVGAPKAAPALPGGLQPVGAPATPAPVLGGFQPGAP